MPPKAEEVFLLEVSTFSAHTHTHTHTHGNGTVSPWCMGGEQGTEHTVCQHPFSPLSSCSSPPKSVSQSPVFLSAPLFRSKNTHTHTRTLIFSHDCTTHRRTVIVYFNISTQVSSFILIKMRPYLSLPHLSVYLSMGRA